MAYGATITRRAVLDWQEKVDHRADTKTGRWAIRRLLLTGRRVAAADIETTDPMFESDDIRASAEYPGVYAVLRNSQVIRIMTASWKSAIVSSPERP